MLTVESLLCTLSYIMPGECNMSQSVAISGGPRTLTSCLMEMTAVMGFDPIADKKADYIRPFQGSFFEYMPLNKRGADPVEALKDISLDGRSVKIFPRNVPPLVEAGILPTHVIYTARPIEEIVDSWNNRFHQPMLMTPEELQDRIVRGRGLWLDAGVQLLDVAMHDMIDDPTTWCNNINNFLGGDFDVEAMISVIDPSLCHFPK